VTAGTDSRRVPLPVIADCGDCGACCTHIGTPPGFAPWFPPPGKTLADTAFVRRHNPDAAIVAKMPREVIASLRGGFDEAWRTNRSGQEFPCFWFDPATRKCLHWEHRPTVCRDLEVGGEECRAHRERCGIRSKP